MGLYDIYIELYVSTGGVMPAHDDWNVAWWEKKHPRRDWPVLMRLVFELGLVAFSLVVSIGMIMLHARFFHG